MNTEIFVATPQHEPLFFVMTFDTVGMVWLATCPETDARQLVVDWAANDPAPETGIIAIPIQPGLYAINQG